MIKYLTYKILQKLNNKNKMLNKINYNKVNNNKKIKNILKLIILDLIRSHFIEFILETLFNITSTRFHVFFFF